MSIKQYTKKTIDAIQFDGYNAKEIKDFCGIKFIEYVSTTYLDSLCSYPLGMKPESYIVLDIPELSQTINQKIIIHIGDYIIKNYDGSLYPCRKDIFENNYMEKD